MMLTHRALLPCKQEKIMNRRPDINHQPAFKVKVRLEASKEEMTTAELSPKYDVTPNRINQWKSKLLEPAARTFEHQKSCHQST